VISVAVVGARGFVGSAIAQAFVNTSGVELFAVTRDTYAGARARFYDVVVNAAMPAGRFWAKNNPPADFTETVGKTADLFYGWKFGKFVQISSVSARCQLDTVYGRHKAAAERICATPETLVVRLGPMYAPTLTKGVLIDMLHGRPVFVAAESRYSFAPLDFVASWIARNYVRTGIVEIGARDGLPLSEVARHLGKEIEFRGARDDQEVVEPEADFPPASGVLAFLDEHGRTASEG
jgi:nucleoside-diphosphate-sugar epimerase